MDVRRRIMCLVCIMKKLFSILILLSLQKDLLWLFLVKKQIDQQLQYYLDLSTH